MSDHEKPQIPPAPASRGRSRFTLPSKPQAAHLPHEPAAETPKLRVSGLCITYIDHSGGRPEAVRDVSFDILDKPGVG